MKISTCVGIQDPNSTRLETDLLEYLRSSTATSKESSPLWSPCLFSDNTRKQTSAVEVTCLVYDFDGQIDNGLASLLKNTGVYHIWHSTATAGNKRLIIAIDAPVPADKWELFYSNVTKAMNITGADPACKNVGRFYFVPLKDARFRVSEGYKLETQDFLNLNTGSNTEDLLTLRKTLLKSSNVEMLSLIRQGLAGKPIAQEGSRDNTVNKLGYYLGKHVVPSGTTPEAVCAIVSMALPGPESKQHWEQKFKRSFDRGMSERVETQEERAKILGEAGEWTKQLQQRSDIHGNTVVISNTYNANMILQNEGTFKFRKNLLEDTIEFRRGEGEYKTLQDHEVTNMANWLQRNYHIQLSTAQVYEQCLAIAHGFEWDPIKEYLETLIWDGVQRMDRLLADYLGCADLPETRIYSRKWLVMLCARAYKPGCKADDVLVLQGDQGLYKSTALRLLSEPWFSDSKVVVGDKDSYIAASRSWVHEFGELASLKHSDRDTIKAFFSSVQDSYRPPYGRSVVNKPRRTVFVATTNKSAFLDDDTGDRRYWVATTGIRIDIEAIKRDKDQLLAEAVQAFKAGEKWWLDTDAERRIQREANHQFRAFPLTAKAENLEHWYKSMPVNSRPKTITTADVLRDAWHVAIEHQGRTQEMEAGRCLHYLGFKKVRNGKNFAYEPPADWNTVKEANAQLLQAN